MLIEKLGNCYLCIGYDVGAGEDYPCGTILFGGPEDYWHFRPAPECRRMTANDLKKISDKLVELNKALKASNAEGKNNY